MKKIIIIVLSILIILIIMLLIPEEQNIESLDKRLAEIEKKLSIPSESGVQLKYPLDPQSRKIVEDIISERIFDSVWNDYLYFLTIFESSDGYDIVGGGAGGSTVDPDGLVLNTGAVLNQSVSFNKTPSPTGPGETLNLLSFQKLQRFRANFSIDSITNVIAYITRGVNIGVSYPYYGFKVVNNTLYGVSRDNNTDGESIISLDTIAINTTYIVEARFYPGEKIVFYVKNNTSGNLEEKGVLTTKLPTFSNTNNKAFFEYFISTQNSGNKMLTSSFFEYIQKR